MEFNFKAILQSDGWIENVSVTTDEAGTVTSIEVGAAAGASGYALPGFRNCHSHAFQYAMAGLAERHEAGSRRDDFWGWRSTMYKLALSLDPEQMEAVAAMLYSEMTRLGHTHVVEFHYLHHDKNGESYNNPAEMAERLVAAAETAGINITVVPVFYQKGGFAADPLPEQRRFISKTIEDYALLLEATEKVCAAYSGADPGVGVHSLRAASAGDVVRIAENIGTSLPFHIHISEQAREVEECLKSLGARPVEWMLDNLELSERFNFVHATHVVPEEISGLAGRGVNVVLCPSTEGNLGDGVFPLREFEEAGGLWSIGTDSHVGLDPFEELRLLDYGQRLVTHRRDTFSGISRSSAENALRNATFAGMRATGEATSDYFEVGKPLNACVMLGDHPLFAASGTGLAADRLLYAPETARIDQTIVNGKVVAGNGVHSRAEEIGELFCQAAGQLLDGLEPV